MDNYGRTIPWPRNRFGYAILPPVRIPEEKEEKPLKIFRIPAEDTLEYTTQENV